MSSTPPSVTPAAGRVFEHVPSGTKTSTPWAWVTVLVPILPAAVHFWYMLQLPQAVAGVLATTPTAGSAPDLQEVMRAESLAIHGPLYSAFVFVGFVVYGLSVVFAYLDHRALARRGFDRPFHWGWQFLTTWVYMIGRTVVAGRRGGRGAAPFKTFITMQIIQFTISLILSAAVFEQISLNVGSQ